MDTFEVEAITDFSDLGQVESILAEGLRISTLRQQVYFSWRTNESEELMEIGFIPVKVGNSYTGRLLYHTGRSFQLEYTLTKERENLTIAVHQALQCSEPLVDTYGELQFSSLEEQVHMVKVLLKIGHSVLGFPPRIHVGYDVNCNEFMGNKVLFSEIRDVWQYIEFITPKYRRRLDLLAKPKDLGSSIRVFPYACARRYDPYPVVPLLAISIVHTPVDSWVELQSARGAAWIEEAATILQQPVEIWEGPQEERWGWYRTPSPGNHVRVFDPSIHKAEVPVYDID